MEGLKVTEQNERGQAVQTELARLQAEAKQANERAARAQAHYEDMKAKGMVGLATAEQIEQARKEAEEAARLVNRLQSMLSGMWNGVTGFFSKFRK